MTHPHPPNQHYKPSIFYLSLYLLIIILSQLIFSNVFRTHTTIFTKINSPKSGVWKIYTNPVDNFYFEYPPDWKVTQTSGETNIFEPNSPYMVNIKIIRNQADPQKTIDSWEKSPFYNVNADSPIKIGHLQTLELQDNTSSSNHDQFMLYAFQGQNLYEITFLSDNPARTAVITRILSSLKFAPLPTLTPTLTPPPFFELSAKDTGRNFSFPLYSHFSLTLDPVRYPLSHMIVCPQVNYLSATDPENYPIAYEVALPGTCRIKNGNFSIQINILP